MENIEIMLEQETILYELREKIEDIIQNYEDNGQDFDNIILYDLQQASEHLEAVFNSI